MPFISAILGFLGKFSLKQYLYGAVAILALTFGLKVYNGVQAHFERMHNLETANAELTQQKQALEEENENKEITITTLKNNIKDRDEQLAKVNKEFQDIRDERERQKRVLEGSRLSNLAASKKTELIEDLANKATKKRFSEFEEAINENN